MTDSGIEGDIGGWCPVQGEGTVDGHAWYFRARGNHWALHIAAVGFEDAVGAGDDSPGWCVWEPWGEREYDAGYMPEDVAWSMIAKAVGLWRSGKAEYFSGVVNEAAVSEVALDSAVASIEAMLPGGPPIDREDLRARLNNDHRQRCKRSREAWGDGVPEKLAWSDLARARVKKPDAAS